MAYNESARFKPNPSQTGQNLGPSYYCVANIPDEKTYHAPFLSNTERKTTVINKVWTSAIYNTRASPKIIGGSSLASRAPRVTFDLKKGAESPGPTKYDPTKMIPSVSRRPRKLYVCKVPFFSEAKGPSVPTQIDENGYSYNVFGKLVKNPPDINDSSIGPAYYKVHRSKTDSKVLYGGCRWSASKRPRTTIEPLNDHPGPGSYDIANAHRSQYVASAERYREMARLFSYQPRTLDLLREDGPSPAEYNLEPALVPKRINTKNAFSTAGDRFRKLTTNTPGPAEYDLQGSVKVKRVSRLKGGFVFKAPRFRDAVPTKIKTPGPASYDIGRGPQQSKRLTYKTVAFDVGAERMMGKEDIEESPGPSDYDTVKHQNGSEPISAIFKSRNPRFKATSANKFQNANSASYNISNDFHKLKNKRSYSVAEVGFQSKEPRRAFRPQSGPSPCYNLHEPMPYKGFYLPIHPRFTDIDNAVPGPGSYTVQPSHGSSLYKAIGTFNLKLKENVLGSKLRLAPNNTRDEWNNERGKRKVLKVFDRPEIQIMESWMDL